MPLRILKPSLEKCCGLLLMALSVAVAAEEWVYTVRPGDNLWNLTERHLKSMEYVQELQKIKSGCFK